MVIFVLAAAAAFLLCVLLKRSPEQLSKRLSDNAHALRLFLFLVLLTAVLFILIAAAASPREVGAVLLALPILALIFTMGSLLYGQSAGAPGAGSAGAGAAGADAAGVGTAGVGAAGVGAAGAGAAGGEAAGVGSASGEAAERAPMQPAVVEFLHKALSAAGISWPFPAEPARAPSVSAEQAPMQPAVVEWLHNAPSRLGHFAAFIGGLVPLGLVVIAFLVPVALLAIPFGSFWFGPLAIGLVIYTWLVGFHALLTRSTHPAFKSLGCEKWQTTLILVSLLFTALLSTLIAWNGDAWAYAILLTTHRVASAPETVHALLGVVAGLMCGNFSGWMDYARSLGGGKAATPSKSPPGHATSTADGQTNERGSAPVDSEPAPAGGGGDPPPPPPRTGRGLTPRRPDASFGKAASEIWPMIVFGIALSGVILAALVSPYAPSALSRVSGLETPYLKVQFAISPAEKQLVLNLERDLYNREALDGFEQTFRFIQYDCAQAALDANVGIDEFRRDNREFDVGLAFRHRLLRYVNQLVNAERRGDNQAVLKVRARKAAEKFALLATTGKNFENYYSDAMSEIEAQEKLFREEEVGTDSTPEESDRQRKHPDPPYCPPPAAEIDLVPARLNANDVKMAVKKRPRLILGVAAALFSFEGNADAANAMFTSIYKLDPNTKDTNAIGGFADTLYIRGDDLREALAAQQADLQLAESRLRQVEAATVWSQKEARAHKDLGDRYIRARFLIRLRLAYMWAQHGFAPEEDLLPQRDSHWSSAQTYADEAYQTFLDKSKSPPRFPCIDDGRDLRIKDTYAFVKLAYEAYNLKTLGIPPNEYQVRQAREILEDALAEAREERRRFEEARSPTGAARGVLSCFTDAGTRAWVKRISSHLKLAEALRP